MRLSDPLPEYQPENTATDETVGPSKSGAVPDLCYSLG